MGFLTDLDKVLKDADKLILMDGWEKRAGRMFLPYGYPSASPTHIMVHHTAGDSRKSSVKNQAAYICWNSSIAPVSNLVMGPASPTYVVAAGPTYTNGSGQDTWGGGVPRNGMNRVAIGIEIANSGTGEPYTEELQDRIVKVVRALKDAYNIPNNNIRAHFDWAPGRKVDPAGPSRWSNNSNRMWDMDKFRREIGGSSKPPPPTGAGYSPPKNYGLFCLDNNKPTISKGWSGSHVRYLQDVIYFEAGGNITRDGQFGPQTEGRVKDLQKFFGFPSAYVDGIVGWSTSKPKYATWPIVDYLATA